VRLSARSLVQSTFARWAAMSRFSEGLPPSSWVWNALAGRLWGRTGWPHFLPASLDCTDVHARTGPPSAAAPPALSHWPSSSRLTRRTSAPSSASSRPRWRRFPPPQQSQSLASFSYVTIPCFCPLLFPTPLLTPSPSRSPLSSVRLLTQGVLHVTRAGRRTTRFVTVSFISPSPPSTDSPLHPSHHIQPSFFPLHKDGQIVCKECFLIGTSFSQIRNPAAELSIPFVSKILPSVRPISSSFLNPSLTSCL
jgi:hypothetical protein